VARPALFESEGLCIGPWRRTLAFGAMTRYCGSRASFDDGRDLATCSISEDVHLRYLRDLRANWDGWADFVSLCLRVCDVRG